MQAGIFRGGGWWPGASIPGGVVTPPKIFIGGVQRVKDPPIKMNMFGVYHEY